MPARHLNFVLILFTTLLCLAVLNPAYASQRHAGRKRPVKQAQATPAPQPTGPLTPLTLEEIPSTPPQVWYRNNQLTIVAQNSTLGDILRAVHNQTGAVVEVPSNATERVVVHLGPGPARDVLATLLNGSHYDYVMLGSAVQPGSVQRLILTSKSGGVSNSGTVQASAAEPPPSQAQPSIQPEQDNTQEIWNDEFTAPQEEAEGDQQPDDQQQQQQQPMNPVPGQPGIRTPEQLLQELQQRQQQQQQGQPQAPPPGAPQGFPIPPQQQQPQPPQ